MEKPILRVWSFSGGKDSTAMLLRMLEEKMPVDVILFCDTGLEFPALYDHIRKVERDIGREITVVKNPNDFEYLFARKKSPANGKHRTPLDMGWNGTAIAGRGRKCAGVPNC